MTEKGWVVKAYEDNEGMSPTIDGHGLFRIDRGGAGSGNFGHTGRPGQRGGSAGGGGSARAPQAQRTAGKTVRGVTHEKWAATGGDLWHIEAGAQMPPFLKNKDALLLVRRDGSAVMATGGSAIETEHAIMAHDVGVSTAEFDKVARLTMYDGILEIHSHQVGLVPTAGDSIGEMDKAAEKRVLTIARQLQKLGYSKDTPLAWTPWARDAMNRPATLEYALEEWKSWYVRIAVKAVLMMLCEADFGG